MSGAAVPSRPSAGQRLLVTLEVFAAAMLVSAVVVALLGHDPFQTLAAIVAGAFGSQRAIDATLAESVPLVLAGLAVALPMRLGMFNVGAEGQLVLGGLAAGLAAAALPPAVAIPAAVLAAIVVGGAWGAIPGALRAWLGVHEVLSTILLNLIAAPLAALVIRQAWAAEGGQIPQSHVATATLSHLWPALAFGAVLALAYDLWLLRTRTGLAARAVGSAPRAAEVAGMRVSRGIFLAMTIAGAVAGLAGAQQVLDQHGRYVEGFSPGFGFTAIAVALLGRGSGLGVLLAAVAMGALRNGAFAMDALGVAPRESATIVQGVVILVAAVAAARDRSAT
ncbi:MAG: ABC transporter permease [Planctomycetes bacterium]|nr:ABC transporter permease [Planctomycetota bacterium]